MSSSFLLIDQIFLGSCHGTMATFYGVQFVSHLCSKKIHIQPELQYKKSALEKKWEIFIAGGNFLGNLARLGDWIVSQKRLMVAAIQLVALKIIAHMTGFFYYFSKAITGLNNLREVTNIIENPLIDVSIQPKMLDLLKIRKYAEWIGFFSNFCMGLYSGIELASLMVGVVVFSPLILNILLTVGFIGLGAFIFLQAESKEADFLINQVRASNPQYSYLG